MEGIGMCDIYCVDIGDLPPELFDTLYEALYQADEEPVRRRRDKKTGEALYTEIRTSLDWRGGTIKVFLEDEGDIGVVLAEYKKNVRKRVAEINRIHGEGEMDYRAIHSAYIKHIIRLRAKKIAACQV
jgi:hypothetical protein